MSTDTFGNKPGMRLAPLLGAVMLLSGGCATLQQAIQTPELSLAGVRLLEASLTRQRYELVLNVHNPNAIALPIGGLSYRVRLAGEDFAAGETQQAFSVPANGETSFSLSVTTDLVSSLTGLRRILEQREETLAYELGGELKVDLPLVRPLPFSKSGEVDLTRLAR